MNLQNKDIIRISERFLSGEASQEDVMLLSNWVRTNPGLNDWVVDWIDGQSPVVDDADLESICQNIVTEKEGKKVGLKTFFLSIAAVIAGFVVLTVIGIERQEPVHPLVVRTMGGEKSRVTLPDGSSVILNALTQLSYLYDNETGDRTVKLYGEAWFDVKTDPEHPFMVDCDNLKVECRGTEFNVTAYPDDSTVTVVLKDGQVNAVSSRDNVKMNPGMLLTYDRTTGHVNTESVTASDYCDWKKGEIHCDNINLEELTKRLARTYGTSITVQSPSLRKERLYGMILEGNLEQVLEIVSEACEANYRKENDNTYYIYRN